MSITPTASPCVLHPILPMPSVPSSVEEPTLDQLIAGIHQEIEAKIHSLHQGEHFIQNGVQNCIYMLSDTTHPHQKIRKSLLMDQIIRLAKMNPHQAHAAFHHPFIVFDEDFKVIAEKVNFMVKNRFISDLSHGFFMGTRFSHHVKKRLGNIKRFSLYGLVGISSFYQGYLTYFAPVPPSQPSNHRAAGLSSMAFGLGFTIAPFL